MRSSLLQLWRRRVDWRGEHVSGKPELVSVLIPAYNAAASLLATVQSVLSQTWPRIEVVIVDDGSTDGTLAVARRLEQGSVKVVTQLNSGAPAARNRAFELAQGRYIQWLDADDLLHPQKIEAQMKVAHALGDPRVLLSGAFGTFYHRPAKAVFTSTSLWRDLTPVDYFLARFIDNVYFQTGAWLVSRELSDAAGPWTDFDSPDDDGEYLCRVVAKSKSVKFVAEARTFYRIGNYGSVAKTRSHRAQTALHGSKMKCIRYLLSLEDSPRTRAACLRLLQDWLPEFYPDREDLVADAEQLADELGGKLYPPTLKWKYQPVRWLAGYKAARMAASILPRIRSQAAREWDHFMFRILRVDSGSNRGLHV
jgi:glycosyltransferase involved in cell wall biosynthesis